MNATFPSSSLLRKLLLFAVPLALLCVAYAVWGGALGVHAGWIVGIASVVVLGTTLHRAERWNVVHPWLPVLAALAVWRLAVWTWSALAVWYSAAINEVGPRITTGGEVIPRDFVLYRTLVYGWMQWDSGYYRAIAVDGYNTTDTFPRIAFFPLYPALIRAARPLVGGDASAAAILLSNIALLVAVVVMYDLARRDFGHSVAYRSVVWLLVFPTSFFFVSGYSESLALVLLCSAVWAIRRGRWWLAGVAGFFLALTRLPGIMVALVLAMCYLHEHGWQWRSIRRPAFWSVLLPPAGFLCFMAYQWWRFDEPFAFMRAQAAWDNRIRAPWGTPLELLATIPTYPDWPMRVAQLATWACFIVLAAVVMRRMPLAYGLTTVLILVPPYLSTWNESLPRYVLLAFPGFIAMALIVKGNWLQRILLGTMLMLCAWSAILFVNKFWIA